MHCEMLSKGDFFWGDELYAATFSDYPSDIYTSVIYIVPVQMIWILDQQKDKKP